MLAVLAVLAAAVRTAGAFSALRGLPVAPLRAPQAPARGGPSRLSAIILDPSAPMDDDDIGKGWLKNRGGLLPDWDLPLLGERLLITSPRASAARLAGFFTEAGATATACPAVRVSPIPAASDNILQLEMACQDLSTVNAVVLASRWAVEAFAERLCRFHGGAVGARQELERSKVRLAATAAAADPLLQRLGVPPAVQVSDGPAGALQLADALAGAAVLWPAPVYVNISEPQPLRAMEAALTARGAALQRVGAYMVRPGDGAQARAELELLRAGEVSVLALTSALEVQGLRHMLGDSLDPVPRGVAVCCSSLEAATEARALGLHAALEPLDADLSIEVLPSAFSLPPSALRPPRRRAAAPPRRRRALTAGRAAQDFVCRVAKICEDRRGPTLWTFGAS